MFYISVSKISSNKVLKKYHLRLERFTYVNTSSSGVKLHLLNNLKFSSFVIFRFKQLQIIFCNLKTFLCLLHLKSTSKININQI